MKQPKKQRERIHAWEMVWRGVAEYQSREGSDYGGSQHRCEPRRRGLQVEYRIAREVKDCLWQPENGLKLYQGRR